MTHTHVTHFTYDNISTTKKIKVLQSETISKVKIEVQKTNLKNISHNAQVEIKVKDDLEKVSQLSQIVTQDKLEKCKKRKIWWSIYLDASYYWHLNLPLPFFVAFTLWKLGNKYKDYNENATIKLNQTLQNGACPLKLCFSIFYCGYLLCNSIIVPFQR